MPDGELTRRIQELNQQLKLGLREQQSEFKNGFFTIISALIVYLFGMIFSLTEKFQWVFIIYFILTIVASMFSFRKAFVIQGSDNSRLEKQLMQLILKLPEQQSVVRDVILKGVEITREHVLPISDRYKAEFYYGNELVSGEFEVDFTMEGEHNYYFIEIPEHIPGLFKKGARIHERLVLNQVQAWRDSLIEKH